MMFNKTIFIMSKPHQWQTEFIIQLIYLSFHFTFCRTEELHVCIVSVDREFRLGPDAARSTQTQHLHLHGRPAGIDASGTKGKTRRSGTG